MERVRTAVIGTGFMGRVHLEALRRVENVDVVEIAATSLDKARGAAAGYNVLNATGERLDVIRDPPRFIDIARRIGPPAALQPFT